MSAKGAMERARKNASSMANTLPSTQSMRHHDWCNGIHGAARARKGIKRGTSAARRRQEKEVIEAALNDE